jgi:hypothetical protein
LDSARFDAPARQPILQATGAKCPCGATSAIDDRFGPRGAVTFVNEDDDLPPAQENHEIVFSNGVDTGVLTPGMFYSITFQKAGTYTFTDKLHPEISGTITID